MKIILSTTRIFCWKVPVETLVIVIMINSWMFYCQFNTHLLMGYICWHIATTRWPLLFNYTQTRNTKIQKKSYTLFHILKISQVFHIAIANWDHKLLKWNMVLVDYIGIFFLTFPNTFDRWLYLYDFRQFYQKKSVRQQ